jgi:ERF superfamily protein
MSTDLTTQRETPNAMQQLQVALEAAISQGSAMDVVTTILDHQKWMIQHSEEQAFNETLKRIQKRLKSIPKRGWNPETKSKFATSEDIDKEIQTLLDEENMTLSFRPAVAERVDEVLIIGLLSLGAYTREYPLNMPADGKGAKGGGVMSRTHATGAAITYAKRYLKNMIFDLRFDETDDDGNGAGISNDQGFELIEAVRAAETAESAMIEWKKAIATAKSLNPIDYRAMTLFTEARDERLKELRKVGNR